MPWLSPDYKQDTLSLSFPPWLVLLVVSLLLIIWYPFLLGPPISEIEDDRLTIPLLLTLLSHRERQGGEEVDLSKVVDRVRRIPQRYLFGILTGDYGLLPFSSSMVLLFLVFSYCNNQVLVLILKCCSLIPVFLNIDH